MRTEHSIPRRSQPEFAAATFMISVLHVLEEIGERPAELIIDGVDRLHQIGKREFSELRTAASGLINHRAA